ncbi:MAG: hypothetical protein RL038_183 [Actinomycetota bacterium]|jgi:hypothetical protein
MFKNFLSLSDTKKALAAAAFSPVALVFGFIAAFIPSAIWQDLRIEEPNSPTWFAVVTYGLAYSLLAPVVALGLYWSVRGVLHRGWVSLIPLAWFGFIVVWQAFTLLGT